MIRHVRTAAPVRPGDPLAEIDRTLEQLAEDVAEGIQSAWPVDTGESAWSAADGVVASGAEYAKHVRRAGSSTPLVEGEIPQIVKRATDRATFDHLSPMVASAARGA